MTTEATVYERIEERKRELEKAQTEARILESIAFLVANIKPSPAPQEVRFIDPSFVVYDIGIGKDNTVSLYMSKSDRDSLTKLLGEPDDDE